MSVPHSRPVVVEELTLRTCPFVPEKRIPAVSFAVPTIRSPFAEITACGIKGFAVTDSASLSTQIRPVVRDVVGDEFVNIAVADVGCPPMVPFESTQIYPFGISAGVKSPATGASSSTSPPEDGRFSKVVISD